MGIYLALLFDFWRTLRRLGGVGLILMGALDSSVIPTPGGQDLLTIALVAREKELWLYYALMATIGSTLGGYLTYRLGRKGGEEALKRRLSKKRIERVHQAFERWGFSAVFAPAIMPPPVPFSPFLLAAGRAVRFTLVAYLASLFGQSLLALFEKHYGKIIIGLIAAGAVAGAIFIIHRYRNRRRDDQALDEA